MPYQPGGVWQAPNYREAIRLSDNLVGNIDDYIVALQPMVSWNGPARELTGSLQDLKNAALSLRQVAAGGQGGNALSRAGDDVMARYQATAGQVGRLVAQNPALNSPSFYRVGEIVQRVVNVARGYPG